MRARTDTHALTGLNQLSYSTPVGNAEYIRHLHEPPSEKQREVGSGGQEVRDNSGHSCADHAQPRVEDEQRQQYNVEDVGDGRHRQRRHRVHCASECGESHGGQHGGQKGDAAAQKVRHCEGHGGRVGWNHNA